MNFDRESQIIWSVAISQPASEKDIIKILGKNYDEGKIFV